MDNKGFRIDYRSDGVFLTVFPPIKPQKKLGLSDVLSYIERKAIHNYDLTAINEAVNKSDGFEYKIAESQEEKKFDAEIVVKVTADKMKALLSLLPPEGGKEATYQEMIDALLQEKIIFGINHDVIENLAGNPVYNKEFVVAEGMAPVNGEDGKIQYHFNLVKDRTPKLLEDGRVDFHQLNLIENVRAGDILATAILPTPGTPGKNVYGEDVPPKPGKPAVLPKGKNVLISEDGLQLIANVDGQVVIEDQKINVYPFYEVSGNVDNSTGDINFVGNVIIKGNVLTGFSVEAGGWIEVYGVVEGATLKAKGDIILHRGMQGLMKGTLIANGNIVAKYIENSNLIAGKDIKCDVIMHSTVQCGGKLELSGRKGLIVGGAARALKEIKAKTVGSPMSTVTELEVGIDPNLRKRYKQLKKEIAAIEDDIKKADQAIEMFKKLESLNRLNNGKRIMMMKALKTKIFLSNKLKDLKKEFEEVGDIAEEEVRGKIKVYNITYPGTRIIIGSSMLYVKDNIMHATFYKDGADIKIGVYED
ncbi:MAG: DUF342 domain-containing protein [Clostridiaceae bacterium]|nr:DUF342 domain-containing protein [Clostridiaceae bacterium]